MREPGLSFDKLQYEEPVHAKPIIYFVIVCAPFFFVLFVVVVAGFFCFFLCGKSRYVSLIVAGIYIFSREPVVKMYLHLINGKLQGLVKFA